MFDKRVRDWRHFEAFSIKREREGVTLPAGRAENAELELTVVVLLYFRFPCSNMIDRLGRKK